jgi:hypothetical protein
MTVRKVTLPGGTVIEAESDLADVMLSRPFPGQGGSTAKTAPAAKKSTAPKRGADK